MEGPARFAHREGCDCWKLPRLLQSIDSNCAKTAGGNRNHLLTVCYFALNPIAYVVLAHYLNSGCAGRGAGNRRLLGDEISHTS